MTKTEAVKMLTAKVECIKRYSSGINEDCNSPDCGECTLWYEQGNMGEQIEYLQMAIKALEEPHWVPVSERLPDDLAEVNITWINHDPEPYYNFAKDKPFTASAVYYKGKWYWYSATCVDYLNEYGNSPADEMDDAIKVIAWMPLPEPWRGDEE